MKEYKGHTVEITPMRPPIDTVGGIEVWPRTSIPVRILIDGADYTDAWARSDLLPEPFVRNIIDTWDSQRVSDGLAWGFVSIQQKSPRLLENTKKLRDVDQCTFHFL